MLKIVNGSKSKTLKFTQKFKWPSCFQLLRHVFASFSAATVSMAGSRRVPKPALKPEAKFITSPGNLPLFGQS